MNKKWFKEHWLEGVGVISAVALLAFVWLSKGSSTGATTAVTKGPEPAKTPDTASQKDLADAISYVQGQFSSALSSMAESLRQAEGADIAAVRAELQINKSNLDTLQKSLQDQIKALAASTSAQDQALAQSLGAQSAALAQLQAQTAASISNLTGSGQVTAAQLAAITGQFNALWASLQPGNIKRPWER